MKKYVLLVILTIVPSIVFAGDDIYITAKNETNEVVRVKFSETALPAGITANNVGALPEKAAHHTRIYNWKPGAVGTVQFDLNVWCSNNTGTSYDDCVTDVLNACNVTVSWLKNSDGSGAGNTQPTVNIKQGSHGFCKIDTIKNNYVAISYSNP